MKIRTWIGSGQLWYATSGDEAVRGVGYTEQQAIWDYLDRLASIPG